MDVEVVIIGGGPAGLQAALTLGRLRRSALLVDSGEYRNAPAAHMHNVVTHDGRAPAQFRALARADVAAYDTIALRDGRVTAVTLEPDGVAVTIDGVDVVRARRLLLATGLRDAVPGIPGLAERFGTTVAHCPFCHGYEWRGLDVGVLGVQGAGHLPALMANVAAGRVVLTDGAALDDAVRSRLLSDGVRVDDRSIDHVEGEGEVIVRFADGDALALGGLFVALASTPAPFAADLGLTTLASGCVEVDAMGSTSDARVFAAGDAAHVASLPMPMASVLAAATAGQTAASGIIASLIR